MPRDLVALEATLRKFVLEECIPLEREYHSKAKLFEPAPPEIETLKARAKSLGLWNLFLPKEYPEGAGLTNREYAPLCEVMGMSLLAPEACNCSAPDTGNMEVLAKYGTKEQKDKWLTPLLNGEIRSTFLMTEPAVASSDARNIETRIERKGDKYVINGRKWWSTGACDTRCKVAIVMGKTDPSAPVREQQSMIIVPFDAPGVRVVRALDTFGLTDPPGGHAEVELVNVEVPLSNILVGEGKGFEIAQGRLGPGRIHHCMRAIGLGERCLDAMLQRVTTRVAFDKPLARQGTIQMDIAKCRADIDGARLLVLRCAEMIDSLGSRGARKEIALIKYVVPSAIIRVADRAIQAHGGMGVSSDTVVSFAWVGMRCLRIADGPDEVHARTVALLELKDFQKRHARL